MYIYIYIYICIYRYIYIYTLVEDLFADGHIQVPPQLGLYKIVSCFWAFVHESILFFAHPPSL